MIFSNKLNLLDFFDSLSEEMYCVIKLDEDFPNYHENSDVDIFCFDINKISNIILGIGNKYVKNDFEIKVHSINKSQVHIDFYNKESNALDLRFDLYQEFPNYKRVNIKPGFFSTIIENRVLNNKNVYVPEKIDDLILRYIEFIEWYEIRADKLKHINYIFEKASESEIKVLLNKLHYYTALPDINIPLSKKSSSKNLKKYLSWLLRPFKFLYKFKAGK